MSGSETSVATREPEVAPSEPSRVPGSIPADAASLAGLIGNRAVARALARTPRGAVLGRGLVDRRAALLASAAGGSRALSRKPVGSTCRCGGTVLPGGECSQCLARRLKSEGLPSAKVQRVIADKRALARSVITPTSSAPAPLLLNRRLTRSLAPAAARAEGEPSAATPCAVVPQMLARIKSDPALEGRVASVLAPFAVGMDGRWLQRQLDPGSRMDAGVQREMEHAFGADFGHVRIHTGTGAQKVARHLNAAAVTIGSHVIIGDSGYSPNSREGRRLLRHELAHVIQQGGGSAIPSGTIRIATPGERSEQEARAVAAGTGPVGTSLSRVSQPQLNATSLCEIACDAVAWGFFSALAALVAAGCAAGSVVTVGGLAIPCTALIVGAAAVGAADAVIWSAILKAEICGVPITAHTPQASATPSATPSPNGASAETATATALA